MESVGEGLKEVSMRVERPATWTGCHVGRAANELMGLAVEFSRQSVEDTSLLLEACGNASDETNQPKKNCSVFQLNLEKT